MNIHVKLFKGTECQHWKWNKGKPFDWLIRSTNKLSYTGKNDYKHIFSIYTMKLNRPRKIQLHKLS